MMPQDQPTLPNRQSALMVGPFNQDEYNRLQRVRHNILEKAEYLDRVIDERRLRFARFLREQGEIDDMHV